jgi:16S rRNA (cytidine1402-2'-O)-methyltransferase
VGTLYLVGTPIGNLEDISFRAVRVLREVSMVAAEDTRQTQKLFARYGIGTRLTSYFEHNKITKLDAILDALAGGDVALVSEAGMPGISDPGYELVRAAIGLGFPVVPVPGPSAAIAALAASGLPTDAFVYLGFLPRHATDRRRRLLEFAELSATLVCFEAPHRLLKSFEDIIRMLGDRPIAVARELTKLHEEIWRGTIGGAMQHFQQTEPRGEFTLVIGGAPAPQTWAEDDVRIAVREGLQAGMTSRDVAADVAGRSRWPRRDVYRIASDMARAHDLA